MRTQGPRRSAALATALGVVCLLLPNTARAGEESPFELTWDSPGCSSAAEVRDEVNRILGGAPKLERRVEVVASVTATATGLALSLTTRIGAAVDHRSAEDVSCAPLRDAAALMIALSIEAARAQQTEKAAPSPDVAPRATQDGAKNHERAPAGEPRPRIRRRIAVGGGFLFDLGTLGGLTNGLELHASARQPYALLEIFGTAFLPNSATASDGGRAGIRVRLLTAGARACVPLPCTKNENSCMVQLCASGELVFAHGDSFGVAFDSPSSATWFAWGPGVRMGLPVTGGTRLSLGLSGLVSLGAPRYALELDGAFRSILQPEYGGRLAVGYEFDVL